ncbi:MAG: SRPBCC family protein [Acidimicrobiia bacterium]
MRGVVAVASTRTIPLEPARVLPAVWEIQNIERCEVKADSVVVTKESDTRGSYRVRGRFAGLPWRGQFFYELHPTGFHSTNSPHPRKGTTISGGFVVEPAPDDACVVTHYEQYRLPIYFRPLRLLVTLYLRWSMRKELRDLEALVVRGDQPQ